MRFLTFTLYPIIDRLLLVNELVLGQANDVTMRCCIPSGSGVNVARILSKLVHEQSVAAVWLGSEDERWFVNETTRLSNVEVLVCPRRGLAQRTNLIIEGAGRQTIINEVAHYPDVGEETGLLEFWKNAVKPGDIVAVCGTAPEGMPLPIVHAIFRIAREQHAAALISDIHVAPAIVASSGLDGIKGSISKISEWLGLSTSLDLEIIGHRETVKEVLSKSGAPASILVMLGKGCAMLITPNQVSYAKSALHGGVNESAAVCDDAATAGWLWAMRDHCDASETLRRVLACWTAKLLSADPDPGSFESHHVSALVSKIEVKTIANALA